MRDKVVVVTGATSGIGRATAIELSKRGASVALVCRDQARGEALQQELSAAGGRAKLFVADLSEQSQVRAVAKALLASYAQLDVLINNAGGIFGARKVTADGLEHTFALNHMAYFLLTELLLELLKKTPNARIINVSSGAHAMATLDFDNLQGEKQYKPQPAYALSKLANVLFTRELAARLQGTLVTANAVHPGVVNTKFGQSGSRLFRAFVWLLRPVMRTPEKGADTIIWLASAPELQGLSGKYFSDRKETKISAAAQDESNAKRLWEVSRSLLK